MSGVVETPPSHSLDTVHRPDGRIGLPVVGGRELTLPPMECSTCHIGQDCPEYKEGFVCFYEKDFKSFNVRETSGVVAAMEAILAQNLKRLQYAYLSEQIVSNGQVDANITRLSSEVLRQMENLVNLKRATQVIQVQAKGKSAGGVLSRMFGAKPSSSDEIELNPPQEDGEVTVTMTKTQGVGG